MTIKTIAIDTDIHRVVPLEPTTEFFNLANKADDKSWSRNCSAADNETIYYCVLDSVLEGIITGWISVEDKLPENFQRVIIKTNEDNSIGYDGKVINVYTAFFVKGKTKEEVARTNSTCFADQNGNNLKPYAWDVAPLVLFGQEVTYWMPIPE